MLVGFAGGAVVGTITGAIKGQTTETGFCRGAAIGAVTGAITAVHLLESTVNGESLSKVISLHSAIFINFKDFFSSTVGGYASQQCHRGSWELECTGQPCGHPGLMFPSAFILLTFFISRLTVTYSRKV